MTALADIIAAPVARKHRCSSLPLLNQCGAAAAEEPIMVDIDGPDDLSTFGTACHKAIAFFIEMHRDPDLRALASEHDCDYEELKEQYLRAKGIWVKEFAPRIAVISVETRLENHWLTGHLDVRGRLREETKATAAEVDWKFGHKNFKSYTDQLTGYAKLDLDDYDDGDCDAAETNVVYVRSGIIETHRFTREQLKKWEWDLRRKLDAERQIFRPHPDYCQYCLRVMDCPGKAAIVRQTIGELMQPEERAEGMALVPTYELYQRVKLVEKACESFRNVLREYVQTGGEIKSDHDTELRLTTVRRTNIDVVKAWPLLMTLLKGEVITRENLSEALKLTKKPIVEALRGRAAKGKKDLAESEFINSLEDAGAVSVSETQQLKEVSTERLMR